MDFIKKNSKWLYFILFALIQYPLKIQGIKWLTYVFIYAIPFLYLIINYKWLISFFFSIRDKIGKKMIYISVYLLIVSLVWPILFQTFDFTYITYYWRSVFLLILKNIFLLAIFERIFKKEVDIKTYLNYFIYSTIIYVVFTLLTIIIPQLRAILMNIIYLDKNDLINLSIPSYKTRFGWSGWSGYGETVHCTLSFVFSWIILLEEKEFNVQIKYLFFSFVCVIGNMLYGRTGLVASFVCMIALMIYLFIIHNYKIIKLISFIFGFFIVALLLLKNFNSSIDYWYNWVFSIVENFITQGSLYDNTGSVETLVNRMYFIPNLKTLLIGDARYMVDGQYYMLTDVGFMRPILYFGVFNYIMMLIIYLKSVIKISVKYLDNKYIVCLLLVIITVLFEMKGETISMIFPVILPMLYLIEEKQKN